MIFTMVALGLFVILPGACWVGYLLGQRARDDETERSRAANWQNALLALAGLLIAFTFSMAQGRFEARKQMVLAEANNIGTTYLRTRLLDDPSGEEIRGLLQRYVDARIAFSEAGADRGRIAATLRQSAALEDQIWSRVAAAGRADRRSPTTSLVVQSTNDMIDAAAERVNALENPLPVTVFLVLVLATAAAMASVGFGCGLQKRPSVHGMLVMPLLLATVILLVFDLAHPRIGIIRVREPALVRLKHGF